MVRSSASVTVALTHSGVNLKPGVSLQPFACGAGGGVLHNFANTLTVDTGEGWALLIC